MGVLLAPLPPQEVPLTPQAYICPASHLLQGTKTSPELLVMVSPVRPVVPARPQILSVAPVKRCQLPYDVSGWVE